MEALPDCLIFLSESSRRIGAAVDADQAARRLCEAAVPRLADAAVAYLAESEADLYSRRAVVDPAGHRLLNDPRVPGDWVHDLAVESPYARSLAAGRPLIVEGTLLVMPLRAHGALLGFAVLLRCPSRALFEDMDVLVAEQLSTPAALTIYHAHLHQRQLATVDKLQRGMRPTRPPPVPGVEIASRYRPRGQTARVGGDWFDVIPLPGSRVALVVGDVMGHGLEAAATMGRLRTAVQTLASLDLTPDQVLRSLDEMALRLAAQTMTTCVYCVYDPVVRRCTIASAGHLPPILVDRNGDAQALKTPAGLPIGVGRAHFETVEIAADDDTLLVLYTDGLVERRGHDIERGVDLLRARLTNVDRPLEELCGSLLPPVPADGQPEPDDITLLMVRFKGIPSDNVANWYLEPQPLTPGRVRRLVRTTLSAWGLDALIPVAELLATELVTNAVRFASRPIVVRLLRTDVLLCEVTDDDHRLPELREAAPTEEDGRGIYLVSQLAERWGTSRVALGKIVWFALKTP